MLLPVFQDLIKPQWRAVLEKLKTSGPLPVSSLATVLGSSYMAVKQHCEELLALHYLERTRLPRSGVGRPEIFYSLGPRADLLFPQAGVDFTLELLDGMRVLLGENIPDKALFQFFQRLQEKWMPRLAKARDFDSRLVALCELRTEMGCGSSVATAASGKPSLDEWHNPLQRVFERYPRALAMEQRLLEQALGCRLVRREAGGGRGGQPRVTFEVA